MAQLAAAGKLPNPADAAFLKLVDERVRPEARSLTPSTWLNLLEADGASYVGVVNDLRGFGPMYGHFGKVRETGVPQTATVSQPDGIASDLSRHTLFRGGTLVCRLPLPHNAPAGSWRLKVTELASGRTAETVVAAE